MPGQAPRTVISRCNECGPHRRRALELSSSSGWNTIAFVDNKAREENPECAHSVVVIYEQMACETCNIKSMETRSGLVLTPISPIVVGNACGAESHQNAYNSTYHPHANKPRISHQARKQECWGFGSLPQLYLSARCTVGIGGTNRTFLLIINSVFQLPQRSSVVYGAANPPFVH